MKTMKIKKNMNSVFAVLIALVFSISFFSNVLTTQIVHAADGSNFSIYLGETPEQQKSIAEVWSEDQDYDDDSRWNNIRIYAKDLFGKKRAVLPFDPKFSHEISSGEHGEPVLTYRYFCQFNNQKLLASSPGVNVENYEVVYAIAFDNNRTPGKGKGSEIVRKDPLTVFGSPVLIKKHAKNDTSFTTEKVLYDISEKTTDPEKFEETYNKWKSSDLDPSLGAKESFSESSHKACRPPSNAIGEMSIRNYDKLDPKEKKQFVNDIDNPAGGGTAANSESGANCSGTFIFSWAVCGITELGAELVETVFQDVLPGLIEDVPVSLDPQEGSFKAWQSFRVIANILLVTTMLAIVYAQARGDK